MGSASDFIDAQTILICARLLNSSGNKESTRKTPVQTLRQDPLFEEAIAPGVLSYHRDLIAVWDLFSLELCRGRLSEFKLPAVPISGGQQLDLFLRRRSESEGIWEVDPWPFAVESLTTLCEGRVLDQRFTDQKHMRKALRDANRATIQFRLVPAAPPA